MIRFHSILSSVFLCLSAFPNLASAQPTSKLTDAQIAEKFSPVKCQIIKGRVDTSSPTNLGGKRYASFPVTGDPGLVMFAEFVNTSGGMRTGDLNPELSFSVPVTSTVLRYPSVFLPRLSWRFSEKYRTVSLELSPQPHIIPSDYEVMIVWTRPSTVLSESQVKKFAFSDPAKYSSHMASIAIQMSSPQGLAALVRNQNSFVTTQAEGMEAENHH
jgi:hypothetical protein